LTEIKGRIFNIGIDVGNAEIKTSKDFNVKSLISVGHDNLDESDKVVKIEFDGIRYTLGKGAALSLDTKYFEDQYKVMLLASIAKSFDESVINANITIGMPISLYREKEFVEEVKKFIANYGSNKITVDGKEKTIKIHNVDVWVESGILFYNFEDYSKQKLLVVDLGGYTVDILQIFYGKNNDSYSTTTGIYSLMHDVVKQVNISYKADLRNGAEIVKSLIQGEDFLIDGKAIDMKFVNEIVKGYCNELFSTLNQRFALSEAKLVFIGGGAILLKDFLNQFSKRFNMEILEKSEFINAYTYETVCVAKNVKE
jgi:plasmid segregation protein ParM